MDVMTMAKLRAARSRQPRPAINVANDMAKSVTVDPFENQSSLLACVQGEGKRGIAHRIDAGNRGISPTKPLCGEPAGARQRGEVALIASNGHRHNPRRESRKLGHGVGQAHA